MVYLQQEGINPYAVKGNYFEKIRKFIDANEKRKLMTFSQLKIEGEKIGVRFEEVKSKRYKMIFGKKNQALLNVGEGEKFLVNVGKKDKVISIESGPNVFYRCDNYNPDSNPIWIQNDELNEIIKMLKKDGYGQWLVIDVSKLIGIQAEASPQKRFGFHAEMQLLSYFGNKGSTLTDIEKEIGVSKPCCKDCANVLKKVGVTFTGDPKDLTTVHNPWITPDNCVAENWAGWVK